MQGELPRQIAHANARALLRHGNRRRHLRNVAALGTLVGGSFGIRRKTARTRLALEKRGGWERSLRSSRATPAARMTCAIAHVESWASTIRSINAMSSASFHLLMVPSLAPIRRRAVCVVSFTDIHMISYYQ